MTRTPHPIEAANGGFPEPPDGPVRIVAARHDGCGAATRVSLPSAIPARVVRLLRCAGCGETYEIRSVEELGIEAPRRARRRLPLPGVRAPRPSLPRPRLSRSGSIDFASPIWRFASVPLAGLAVIAGLMMLQRGAYGEGTAADDLGAPATAQAAQVADTEPGASAAVRHSAASGEAKFVRGASFSVALPPGWKRVGPQAGASFAAAAAHGDAEATLWIERDPSLDFASFESRSLEQLRALAGSAEVLERVGGPTADASIVRLAADAPTGEPEFEVTLRASGPYRYYLSTTVEPDASRAALDGAELIHGTFTPEAASRAGS